VGSGGGWGGMVRDVGKRKEWRRKEKGRKQYSSLWCNIEERWKRDTDIVDRRLEAHAALKIWEEGK